MRLPADRMVRRALLSLTKESAFNPASSLTLDFEGHYMERGSSAVECQTRNQVSPGSNPPLLQFQRLAIFVLSVDARVDSAEL